MNRLLITAALSVLFAACATSPSGPKQSSGTVRDGAPMRLPSAAEMADAQPRPEAILPRGNRTPYEVFGEEYHLIEDYRGFRQRGVASWYGTKFHGRLTSNGEEYNLYAMSAAHKTLPIPLYVKVTNLDNGRTAIVRVNDRGPFHSDRIIDLSYSAAVKLGFADRGTAPVEIEVIDTDNTGQPPVGPQYYLQVAAFSQLSSAQRLENTLRNGMPYPVRIASSANASADASQVIHRVRIGPLVDFPSVQAARKALAEHWQGQPSLLTDDGSGKLNF